MKQLETERLVIRPFDLSDLEQAYQALDVHPDVWRFDPGFERTREDRQRILINRIAEYDTPLGRDGFCCLAVTVKETEQVIGYSGLQVYLNTAPTTPEDGPGSTLEVEYYYKLHRDFWGQGLATEAGRAMLDFAFKEMKLKRIATGTHRDNIRSIDLLRRLGAWIKEDPLDADSVIGVIVNPYRSV